MAYKKSTNTDPTKALLNENSTGVTALQKSLNAKYAGQAGYTPLKEDGLYGPATLAATKYAPTAVAEPTIGAAYAAPSFSSPTYDAARSDYDSYYSRTQPDENKIRRNVLNEFQAEIDAQNAIFDQKLRESQTNGRNRLGSDTAIQGRRGLLGSDFGASQTSEVTAGNTAANNLVQQERGAALAAIMGKARSEATAEIAAKRAAYEKGLDSRLEYLKGDDERRSTRAKAAAQSLLDQGFTPDELGADTIAQLAKSAGVTTDDIIANYKSAQVAKEAADKKVADDAAFNLSEGQARYDADGNIIASRSKTYAPSSGGGAAGATGTYVVGQNPTVDSWVTRIQNGSAKITDIPASQFALRNAVSVGLVDSGNNAEGKPTTTELGKAALTTAKGLLTKLRGKDGSSAVGGSKVFGASKIPGTAASDFAVDFDSLKAQLALEGVKYLKGQGAVSDSERALLAAATTKLNRAQSKDEFEKTLVDIISRLQGGAELSDAAPTTGEGYQSSSGKTYNLPN